MLASIEVSPPPRSSNASRYAARSASHACPTKRTTASSRRAAHYWSVKADGALLPAGDEIDAPRSHLALLLLRPHQRRASGWMTGTRWWWVGDD
jgi:hypothetical protein